MVSGNEGDSTGEHMAGITLHQFLYSHFNEKARWALAFKGVPHERRSYRALSAVRYTERPFPLRVG